jgi:hypothetical protein
MLLQDFSSPTGIVFIIIAIILLFLFNYLAVRWIESKEMARRKKGACFFAGLLGVLLFIFFIMAWGALFGIIVPTLIPAISWPSAQPLIALGPMLVFLIYIALIHGLIGTDWKKSIKIGILSMFLLAAFLAFTPYAAQYIQFYP